MFKSIVVMILFSLILISSSVWADDFYTEHEKGWYWFDDPKEVKTNHKEPKNNPDYPIEEVNRIKIATQRALDLAILHPTSENLERYVALQNKVSENANQFANMWQKVLLEHPELNYSISHPTNNIALQVYHENESTKKEAVIREFAKRSGLFFFYRSTCPYCKRFAPILKHFTDAHHIAVIAITTDGIVLPEFPDSREDHGQAKKFKVSVEPSLYAVDPHTQKAFPIAFGLTSETELQENIYNIMTRYTEGIS